MLVERGACYGIIVAARPAPLLCVVVAAVVLLYIYLICNTSSAQNTGWVTTAGSAYLLRGINCNYLVLIGPRYQLGAAGHQDTASRSTHITHSRLPFQLVLLAEMKEMAG